MRAGDLLFCAGQIPIDPATGNLVAGDIQVQTERVLQNAKAILDDQKLTFANVVKSTVFMTNLADFAGMNEVYAKYDALWLYHAGTVKPVCRGEQIGHADELVGKQARVGGNHPPLGGEQGWVRFQLVAPSGFSIHFHHHRAGGRGGN